MQPREGELNPHRQNNQSHETRDGITRKPAFSGFAGNSCDKHRTNQVTSPATATATKAVTGRPSPECAAESVMTP